LGDALLEAAAYGRLSIVETLIEAGANPLYTAAPTEQFYDNEWPGSTPNVLMSAARSGIPDVVERILKARPDVNQRDDHGWTALHYAARPDWRTYAQDPPERNPTRVVERLIAAGADVNAKTKAGKTPLALEPYDREVVTALRNAGGH
jgi:ankyrin repeat protein